MAQEIERKFLVDTSNSEVSDILSRPGTLVAQGYIKNEKESTVRVRLMGDKGYLTIKGAQVGISRPEFEYEIPFQDAREMIETLCEGVLKKTRYFHALPGGLVVEIDVFEDIDLVLAEVELPSADTAFEPLEWMRQDVSQDPEYFNACLIKKIARPL